MREHYYFILSFILLLTSGCASGQKNILYSAPNDIPFTTQDMKTAGYWISRHPFPDRLILSNNSIKKLNYEIRNNSQAIQDIANGPVVYSGDKLRTDIQTQFNDLQASQLVKLNGEKLSQKDWANAELSLNMPGISSEIPRQYGLIIRYTDQKFLPTEEGLYAKAFDVDFDELQNSALDIGTAVIILHESEDKQWLYVRSSTSSSWVRSEDVALATENQIKTMLSEKFIVTTAPKTDIYLNSSMTKFLGYTLMGTRLPVTGSIASVTEVLIPSRKSDGTAWLVSGFIANDQVHNGYLPYTARNVILQAFKMLNAPYGWGGMYGEQDCSRFLQEIFATVGIQLPRDSKNQIKSGYLLTEWDKDISEAEKLNTLKNLGIGGITVLGMKGHIVLYLGMVNGRAYAIHSVWAYRKPRGTTDDTFILNRVVVSDLSLGEGSKRGSLLKRINTVRFIQ